MLIYYGIYTSILPLVDLVVLILNTYRKHALIDLKEFPVVIKNGELVTLYSSHGYNVL